MKKALFLFAIVLLTISLLVGCEAKTKVNSDNINNQQQISTTDNKLDVLKRVKDLANVGKVEGSGSFAIGSKRTEVEKAWGKSTPGEEETEAYPQKHILMYYDESNQQVRNLYTTSPALTNITYDEVIKALGQPVDIREDEGIINIFYNLENNKYELVIRFVEEKINYIKVQTNIGHIPQSQ